MTYVIVHLTVSMRGAYNNTLKLIAKLLVNESYKAQVTFKRGSTEWAGCLKTVTAMGDCNLRIVPETKVL